MCEDATLLPPPELDCLERERLRVVVINQSRSGGHRRRGGKDRGGSDKGGGELGVVERAPAGDGVPASGGRVAVGAARHAVHVLASAAVVFVAAADVVGDLAAVLVAGR